MAHSGQTKSRSTSNWSGSFSLRTHKFSAAEAKEAGAGNRAGIYARLSADGYLDCTDWGGPFGSATTAARYLLDMYGDWG